MLLGDDENADAGTFRHRLDDVGRRHADAASAASIRDTIKSSATGIPAARKIALA